MSAPAGSDLTTKSWRYFRRKRLTWSAGLFLMALAMAWDPLIVMADGRNSINMSIQLAALVIMVFGFPPNGVAPKDPNDSKIEGMTETSLQTIWHKQSIRRLLFCTAAALILAAALYAFRYGFLVLEGRAAMAAALLGITTGIFAQSVTHFVFGPPTNDIDPAHDNEEGLVG